MFFYNNYPKNTALLIFVIKNNTIIKHKIAKSIIFGRTM